MIHMEDSNIRAGEGTKKSTLFRGVGYRVSKTTIFLKVKKHPEAIQILNIGFWNI